MGNTQDASPNWWKTLGIKDWVYMFMGIGFVINMAGGNASQKDGQETIKTGQEATLKKLSEFESIMREQARDNKAINKEMELRLRDLEIKINKNELQLELLYQQFNKK